MYPSHFSQIVQAHNHTHIEEGAQSGADTGLVRGGKVGGLRAVLQGCSYRHAIHLSCPKVTAAS